MTQRLRKKIAICTPKKEQRKEDEEEEITGRKYNGLPYSIERP